MPFAYYKKLTARQKRIYDASDREGSVRVPAAEKMARDVEAIAQALARDDRTATARSARRLTERLLGSLHVRPVQVRVLAVRPSNHREELHGQYELSGRNDKPTITVWMRTAQRRQVVAFRTFLRTLLHEITHHLDYDLLKLEDSFHTQGFYKRESTLVKQLAPPKPLRTQVKPQEQPALPFE